MMEAAAFSKRRYTCTVLHTNPEDSQLDTRRRESITLSSLVFFLIKQINFFLF
jgi:hypothetical protein